MNKQIKKVVGCYPLEVTIKTSHLNTNPMQSFSAVETQHKAKKMKQFNLLSLFLILITFFGLANSTIVSHDERAITIDGQRRILISGSIHYPRSTSDVTTCSSTSFVNLFLLPQVIFIFFFCLCFCRCGLI